MASRGTKNRKRRAKATEYFKHLQDTSDGQIGFNLDDVKSITNINEFNSTAKFPKYNNDGKNMPTIESQRKLRLNPPKSARGEVSKLTATRNTNEAGEIFGSRIGRINRGANPKWKPSKNFTTDGKLGSNKLKGSFKGTSSNSKGLFSKLFKNVKPDGNNLMTGKKLTPLGTTIGIGLALGYSAIKASKFSEEGDKMDVIKSQAEDMGPISGHAYDGIGSVNRGKRDLGATGELVFGMHRGRKG